MLTRIEISGFKTFDAFELDVPPFLAVVGPNASGKSNLFDALEFLRNVTESGIPAAVRSARGDVEDLFRRRGDGSTDDTMTMAVEVLLDPRVADSWGTEVELTQTRLRYELTLAKRPGADGDIRLLVVHEGVRPIAEATDTWRAVHRPSASFDAAFIRDRGRREAFLETIDEPSGRVFLLHDDGSPDRTRSAAAAAATVLSSTTTAGFGHLYALREEILSWRFLQLDPDALRLPGEKFGESHLVADGANLARVLHRIQAETATEDDDAGALADISADLASLIDGIASVEVRENAQTRKWEMVIHAAGEGSYSATVASDGTLRILALLASLYDPSRGSLVCFEEPENGVHPLTLRTLITYLRDLVPDPKADDVDASAGLTQVILTSHSPGVLAAVGPGEAVVLDSVVRIERGPQGARRSRVSRVRSMTPPAVGDVDPHALVSPQEVRRYEAAALFDEAL